MLIHYSHIVTLRSSYSTSSLSLTNFRPASLPYLFRFENVTECQFFQKIEGLPRRVEELSLFRLRYHKESNVIPKFLITLF